MTGYIGSVSWRLARGTPAQASVSHVEESAGYEGEWVTLVLTNPIDIRIAKTRGPFRFKRDNRPVRATRAEAMKDARQALRQLKAHR